MTAKVTLVCHCGKTYQARQSDVARGWGLSCSKACAAKKREVDSALNKMEMDAVSGVRERTAAMTIETWKADISAAAEKIEQAYTELFEIISKADTAENSFTPDEETDAMAFMMVRFQKINQHIEDLENG